MFRDFKVPNVPKNVKLQRHNSFSIRYVIVQCKQYNPCQTTYLVALVAMFA